ncbi:hypothetical protein BC828DRAFT_378524 [Blastocladiella britannica]|nr:hypothetical protein BC828DRAFT_378524 [Blastocladiella britannica]
MPTQSCKRPFDDAFPLGDATTTNDDGDADDLLSDVDLDFLLTCSPADLMATTAAAPEPAPPARKRQRTKAADDGAPKRKRAPPKKKTAASMTTPEPAPEPELALPTDPLPPCPLCTGPVEPVWLSAVAYMELCGNVACSYPFHLPPAEFRTKLHGHLPRANKPVMGAGCSRQRLVSSGTNAGSVTATTAKATATAAAAVMNATGVAGPSWMAAPSSAASVTAAIAAARRAPPRPNAGGSTAAARTLSARSGAPARARGSSAATSQAQQQQHQQHQQQRNSAATTGGMANSSTGTGKALHSATTRPLANIPSPNYAVPAAATAAYHLHQQRMFAQGAGLGPALGRSLAYPASYSAAAPASAFATASMHRTFPFNGVNSTTAARFPAQAPLQPASSVPLALPSLPDLSESQSLLAHLDMLMTMPPPPSSDTHTGASTTATPSFSSGLPSPVPSVSSAPATMSELGENFDPFAILASVADPLPPTSAAPTDAAANAASYFDFDGLFAGLDFPPGGLV